MKDLVVSTSTRALKVAYWTATFQLLDRFRMWRASKTRIEVTDAYDRWVKQCDTLDDNDRNLIRADIATLADAPLISIIMPTYDTSPDLLRQAVESVQAQLYENWELCIADDASPNPDVVDTIRALSAADPRIKFTVRPVNGNISEASNSALTLVTGEFVALMDHDDLLPAHALYRVAKAIVENPAVNVLYSDEDQIDGEGHRHTPYFKPDWNIDLLLGHNFISHLGVYRTSLIREIGGFRVGYEGSQDYDLALRAAIASAPGTIRHIPAILYHWRRLEGGSFSQEQLDRCVAAARRAVSDAMTTLLGHEAAGNVSPGPIVTGWTRVRWPLPQPVPTVSIIIPTRDRADLLRTCLNGLLERTQYPAFEIVIVDNDSVEENTFALFREIEHEPRVRILKKAGAFNYSLLNNFAVRHSDADVIVLLNNDIDIIEPHWLEEMVSHAMRPDIGAVGAKLIYADETVQHAGVLLGAGEFEEGAGVAGHFGHSSPRNDVGYFGQFVLTRELSAVTGACLAMRREVFERVGGLDEEHLKIAFNDVDLCLRIREAGLRIIWTPFAELYHLESQSRGDDLHGEKAARFRRECEFMFRRWGDELRADPFYNPNFERGYVDFRLAFRTTATKPWLPPKPVRRRFSLRALKQAAGF